MTNATEWLAGADVDKEWRRGLAALVRIRSIAVAAISNTIGFGALWRKFDLYRAFPLLLGGAAVVACLVAVRIMLRRACSAGDKFHQTCHAIREKSEELNQAPTDELYAERLSNFHAMVAENIAEFFRTLMWDSSMHCIVRLAAKGPAPCYITVGRSLRMDARRSQSEPIPANRGIPQGFLAKDCQGVCIIRDIEKAAAATTWHATKTDSLPDVKISAIAPINSYEDGVKSMYGMLCVSSRTRLSHIAIEPLKAFADMLGFTYSAINDKRRARVKKS